jgi:hypothetical protein
VERGDRTTALLRARTAAPAAGSVPQGQPAGPGKPGNLALGSRTRATGTGGSQFQDTWVCPSGRTGL